MTEYSEILYREYNCRNNLEAGPHYWKHTASYTDLCMHCGVKLTCANPQQTWFPPNWREVKNERPIDKDKEHGSE